MAEETLHTLALAAFLLFAILLIAALLLERRRRKVAQEQLSMARRELETHADGPDLRSKAATTPFETAERRRIMEAHQEDEERFRSLVEQVKDHAIFSMDFSGNIASWNLGAERIYGYPAEEILGKHFSVFHTEEDLATRKPWRIERDRFRVCEYRHFSSLFSADSSHPDSTEILFLLARHGRDLLAGAIIAISARTATYLFGASSNKKRNLMASYAVQWEAMQIAKTRGCLHYDLGAVSPAKDPSHPYFGLHRFKVGFGGRIDHQSGSWDYPLDEEGYKVFRNSENMDGILSAE